jgi:predicted transcriptional regulator of viral defense system
MRAAAFFREKRVFTRGEFLAARIADGQTNPRTADSVLNKHIASGDLVHVRRGLYAVATGAKTEADPFLIAGKAALDAAVAYHAALQFHGKAYSVWHRYSFVTTKNAKPFSFGSSDFVPVALPRALRAHKDLGGGIKVEPHAGQSIRVATLERTLVDVLDRPQLGGGWEEIWRSLESVDFFDLDAVTDYALKLDTVITIARVGYFLDQHREQLFVTDEHLKTLLVRAPRQPLYFDQRTRQGGTLVKRWNLIVPKRVQDRSWEETTNALA